MNLQIVQIKEALNMDFAVLGHNISPRTVITDIRLLPEPVGGVTPPLSPTTAYVCDYRDLLKHDLTADLAPLICAVAPGTDSGQVFFNHRSAVIVYSADTQDVLACLARRLFDCGCAASTLSEFSRVLLHCSTPQERMETASRLINNPIILTNAAQHIIAYTPPCNTKNPAYSRLLTPGHLSVGHPSVKQLSEDWRHPNDTTLPSLDSGSDTAPDALSRTLSVGSAVLGFLHAFALDRPFRPQDGVILDFLGDLIAADLYRTPNYHAPALSDPISHFLRLILDNALLDESVISRKQLELGFHPSDRFRAVVFHTRTTDNPHGFSLENAAKRLAQSMPDVHCLVFRDSVFMLWNIRRKSTDPEKELSPLLPLMKDLDLIAGISNPFPSISSVRKFGFQARKALSIGTALHPDGTFFSFSRYTVYYMMELALKTADADMLYAPELDDFFQKCGGPDGSLSHTLQTYLRCGCSKSETAREMYLHLNTVKQRMKQIEDHLGFDPAREDHALRLSLSFRLLEYVHTFPSGESTVS